MAIEANISAYIPCFNNANSIGQTITSIRAQKIPVAELFVMDDASTDNSIQIAEFMGVKVVPSAENEGRGAVRAKAMKMAGNELVLAVDSGIVIESDYLEKAISWYQKYSPAAVFGQVVIRNTGSLANRWAQRHIYKLHDRVEKQALLMTGACLVRRSVVIQVGNFNNQLRHSEDRDLGKRLLAAGYEVIFDPEIIVSDVKEKSVLSVLKSYWRWHAGEDEQVNFYAYLRQVAYSIKVMALEDVKARDFSAAVLSLICPHFQLWSSIFNRLNKRR